MIMIPQVQAFQNTSHLLCCRLQYKEADSRVHLKSINTFGSVNSVEISLKRGVLECPRNVNDDE